MGTLNSWEIVDANNNAAPPDGWPENTMNYSDVNNTGRAVQGTMKRFFADINGSLDAGGAADAYTLTLNETGYTAYFDGMMFACSIPATNLTATPTIDVNGIGAQTITDLNGNAISAGELAAGSIHEFRYDGTNFRIIGTGGVAGLDTQFQFNNAGIFGGASGFTYDTGTDEATVVNPLNISTDIVFTEQSDHSSTPGPGFGYLWVRDDNPSILIFTNDAGVDTQVGTAGVSLPGGADTDVQYNDGGTFGGTLLKYIDADDRFSMVEAADPSGAGMISMEADDIVSGRMLSLEAGSGGLHGTGNIVFAFLNSTLGGSIDFGGAFRADVNNDSNAFLARMNDDGHAFHAYTNSTNRSRSLVYFESDNASPGAAVLEIQNDATDNLSPSIALNGAVGGIQFNNTNFSTDANTLDWYEEGTFTPGLDSSPFGDGTSQGQTYGLRNGEYTRIGRTVWFHIRLIMTSLGSLSGTPLYIVFDGTLPNNTANPNNYPCAFADCDGLAITAGEAVTGYYAGINGAIILELWDATTGTTFLTAAEISADGEFNLTGFYVVNSA